MCHAVLDAEGSYVGPSLLLASWPPQVLLVEPCEMVRTVLALDMRAWGCSVCAVASEQAAIARLRLRGAAPLQQ